MEGTSVNLTQRISCDEENLQWIIKTARSFYDENIYKAKSWLLTGATMFPENISLKVLIAKELMKHLSNCIAKVDRSH